MKNYLSLLLLFVWLPLFSQTAIGPNLTLGASEVLFQKGKLDSELIAEIVSTKQDEIRTEMVKRYLSKNLVNSNVAIQSFVQNNLDVLFDKSAIAIKKKEMLKSAAELALVIGFSEYYLQDLANRIQKNELNNKNFYTDRWPDENLVTKDEVHFLFEYMRRLDNTTKKIFCDAFFDNVKIGLTTLNNELKNFNSDDNLLSEKGFFEDLSMINKIEFSLRYYRIDGFSDFINQSKNQSQYNNKTGNDIELYGNQSLNRKYLSKVSLLATLKNHKDYSSERKDKFESPNHLLIDLVYSTLSKNESIQNLGFFQRDVLNASMSDYSSLSEYINYFEPLKSIINDKADNLTKHYELIIQISKLKANNPAKLRQAIEEGIKIDKTVLSHQLKAAINELKKINTHLDSTEIAFFKQLMLILEKPSLETEDINNLLLYLQKEVIPQLTTAAISNKNFERLRGSLELVYSSLQYYAIYQSLSELMPSLQSLKNFQIFSEVKNMKPSDLGNLSSKISSLQSSFEANQDAFDILERALLAANGLVGDQFIKARKEAINAFYFQLASKDDHINELLLKYEKYLTLLSYLSNLDQALTYDRIFKFLGDLGNIFNDSEAAKIIDIMTNYLDKYTIPDTEKNTISIDIEGLTGDLYNHYQQNLRSRVSLSFTVGVNHALPLKNGTFNFAEDTLGNVPSNASFISEKIGIKWRVFDFNRRFIRGNLDYQPIFNNIHLTSYFSGLLYEIDALNSVDGFNNTTLGVGIGTTFFNGLDLTISYAGILGAWTSQNYLNVGFDIQFTEYLTALNKKRKQKKLEEN